MRYYKGDIKPADDVIFVFGSNLEGRHGKGAAKTARRFFSAEYGNPRGLQGNSFAIPTKDLNAKEHPSISKRLITECIKDMYDCALENPDKRFMVAYRNITEKSLNGYTGIDMIDMFLDAGEIPENIYFSEEWYKHLTEPQLKLL